MTVLVILSIMAVATSGAIGYFLAYIKNEKELRRNPKKYNPKSGWYIFC